MKTLDLYIKELRKILDEGKNLYGQCTMSYNYLSNFDAKIKRHMSKLQTFTTRLQELEVRIEDSKTKIEKIHSSIRGIEFYKEKVLRRFSILKEYLLPKIVILQRQLEECLTVKNSYYKFTYTNLSIVEVASYALFALISISDTIKGKWKDLDMLMFIL